MDYYILLLLFPLLCIGLHIFCSIKAWDIFFIIKEYLKSFVLRRVCFWADINWRTETLWHPARAIRGVSFPLQILSLPLLYSPSRPPRRRRRLPLFLLRGFVLARTRPGFWIHAYTHTDNRSRKLRNLHRNRRLRGKPADLYWFLPSNTQSDIFLLRRSTRLAPDRALFGIKRGKRLRSEGVKVPSHEGQRQYLECPNSTYSILCVYRTINWFSIFIENSENTLPRVPATSILHRLNLFLCYHQFLHIKRY